MEHRIESSQHIHWNGENELTLPPVSCELCCRWFRYESRPRSPRCGISRRHVTSEPWLRRHAVASAWLRNDLTTAGRRRHSPSARSSSRRRLDPTGSNRAASLCRRRPLPKSRAASRTRSVLFVPETDGSHICCRAERQTRDRHSPVNICSGQTMIRQSSLMAGLIDWLIDWFINQNQGRSQEFILGGYK